jgi:hypothetical protein
MGTRLFVCALLATLASGQQTTKLTPRELFYSAPQTPAAQSAAAPAVAAKTTVAASGKPKHPAATQNAKTVQPAVQQSQPAAVASQPKASASEPANASSGNERSPFVNASFAGVKSYGPLGLRYSILKRSGGSQEEVDTDSVFHAGDRIRVSVEANGNGYLYIVNRGSSGTWKVLFPSPEVATGSNRVEGGRRYEIPEGYTFTFDEQPGVEKLFIVLARQPVPDLDNLIYSLSQGHAAPAAQPEESKPPERMMLASNIVINDPLIGRMRETYARDLVIEKVDDKTPPDATASKPEKAVYAVNASGAADARVVADLALNHQ